MRQMTYQCNDSSCRPCKHVELDDLCPNCLKNKLIVSPSDWVFCPNFYTCEWEMSYSEYRNTDTDVIRRATRDRLISQYESEIESLNKKTLKNKELIVKMRDTI